MILRCYVDGCTFCSFVNINKIINESINQESVNELLDNLYLTTEYFLVSRGNYC